MQLQTTYKITVKNCRNQNEPAGWNWYI